MRRLQRPWVPRYARIPLAVVLGLNLAVFYITKQITAGWRHYQMALPLDAKIPFCAPFVVIYVLAFAQWVVGYVSVAREDRGLCCEMVAADVVAKLLCLVCFLVVPTTYTRPALTQGGVWEWVMGIIYRMDSPVNLFPSIHCLESWLCGRYALRMTHAPRWYRVGMAVLAVLVCASTVLVKQHVLVDIPAGILAAELGILAARRLGLARALRRRTDRR